MPDFSLRAPRLPDDAEAMARVQSAANPDWPTSAEQVIRQFRNRNPEHFHADLVAEKNGEIVGAGGISHDDFSFEAWRYWGGLGVHPAHRNGGIGRALYAELLRRVRDNGAREIRTSINDAPENAPGRAFLERRGFRPAWERYESSLDTRQIDLTAFDDLLAGVRAQGVRLVSLAELAADPERNRRLYELDWELFQDVPLGTPLTKRPFGQWVKDELDDPQLRPELSFVAVQDGLDAPGTGPYVGYSTLGENVPGGYYFIGMTGVRRDWRGKGIAKALKVAAMRALQAAGGGQIKTFNDKPNQAMLRMNEGLGFQRTRTIFRYELHLGDE